MADKKKKIIDRMNYDKDFPMPKGIKYTYVACIKKVAIIMLVGYVFIYKIFYCWLTPIILSR